MILTIYGMIYGRKMWRINFTRMSIMNRKKKFDILKNNKNFVKVIKNINLNFDTPEWGYPKGRRIYLEKILIVHVENLKKKRDLKAMNIK